MGAKRTSDLIPMCHPLQLSSVKVEVAPCASGDGLIVTAGVRCSGRTGVERVDLPRRLEILRLVEDIRDKIALPILYVTHETGEARQLGAEIVPVGPT